MNVTTIVIPPMLEEKVLTPNFPKSLHNILKYAYVYKIIIKKIIIIGIFT